MAVTLTDFGAYKLTNNATAGNVTAVTFPGGTGSVLIYSESGETRVSDAGTDGSAIGNDYFPIPSSDALEWPLEPEVYGRPPVLYIAHSSNSGVTRLVPIFGLQRVR